MSAEERFAHGGDEERRERSEHGERSEQEEPESRLAALLLRGLDERRGGEGLARRSFEERRGERARRDLSLHVVDARSHGPGLGESFAEELRRLLRRLGAAVPVLREELLDRLLERLGRVG